MNRPYDEQISALADGELGESELPLLLRQAGKDGSLQQRMGRYALIRDALSRNLPAVVDESLADRVASALEAEPAHRGNRQVPRRSGNRWLRPVAGLAVAASVAMLGVIIWPTAQSPGVGGGTGIASAPQTSPAAVEFQRVSADSIRWDRLDPEVQARLNGYALSHGEEAAGRQLSIIPQHVRITGHSVERR